MSLLKLFKKKTRNYYDAPPFYRKLFDIGVPERYWYVRRKELNFVPIKYDDEYDNTSYNISVKKQERYLNRIISSSDPTGVVAVSSEPTSDMALAFSFYLAKELLRKGMKIQIHNMYSGINHLDITGKVLFLYNINAEDDPHRLQNVRDVIFQTNGILRIVAFAGENPLTFFCEKLRYYPNQYFYLLGKFRQIRSID